MTRSTYTSELAAAICARAAKGQNLRAISEQPGMPNRVTLHRWLNRHAEFRRRYDEACARRAFVLIRPKTDPAAPRRRSPIYTPERGAADLRPPAGWPQPQPGVSPAGHAAPVQHQHVAEPP